MVRLCRWLRRRDRRSSNTTVNTNPNSFNVRFFSYDTLRIATSNFSTIVGEGAYGRVFKGVLPGDGSSVAIKVLLKPYRDGFLEMVEFMSHLRHTNLIRVIGCCLENDEQILVCEFAENGSVGQSLHSTCEKSKSSFNWERRAAVCIGTARGLSYLHEEIVPRIIHCDVKPANILLDANFNPKIVDFDFIHFVDRCDTSSNVGIKGTIGYMDPEYVIRGRQLTQKVDVYSFGLVMLEIISGRKAVDFASKETDNRWILNWVMKMRKDHNISDIIDPKLIDFPEEDVERFINVALLCTQSNSEQRPSMFRVVHMLYGGHKSDQEISEMATEAITTHCAQWFSDDSIQTCAFMRSLTISTSGEKDSSDGSTSTRTKDDSTE